MNTMIGQEKINDWKLEKDRYYTEDDLINAYLQGKKAGFDIEKRVMLEKLQQNLFNATNIGVELFENLASEKINCSQCFLKIENPIAFKIIYIIDKESYNEENLKKLYFYSREKRIQRNQDNFYISFSFIPNNGELNIKRLIADGYILNYNQQG